jgi:hypothetical protein
MDVRAFSIIIDENLNLTQVDSLISGYRHNVVTDLVNKPREAKKLFLTRCNQYLQQNLGSENIHCSAHEGYTLQLSYLPIVFSSRLSSLPVYEFIKVEVVFEGQVFESFTGVMFSSYTHDYDRDSIQNIIDPNQFILSVSLWESLFTPNKINSYAPPLTSYPMFVFPMSAVTLGKTSPTDAYMNLMRMTMRLGYTTHGVPLRIYYNRKCEYINSIYSYCALLAVGQATLELTRPDLYARGTSEDFHDALAFDWKSHTPEKRQCRKNRFINWLSTSFSELGESREATRITSVVCSSGMNSSQ